MAAIVWADVVALQANLSTVSVAAQMIFLAYVNEDLNPAAFGGDGSPRYHLARVYMAAHLGELERRNGTSGNVSSETYGRSSVTIAYATNDEGLMATSWGQAFKSFLDASPLRIGLTTGPT